jgi:carboxymethylenebutenolidase
MSDFTLTMADGFALPISTAGERERKAVIVVQEIFGVNEHIRWVLQAQYAAAGFYAIAPHFFERVEPGFSRGYSADDFTAGRAAAAQLGFDQALRDVRSVQQFARAQKLDLAGVVGFCWGGTLAALAATRLGLPGVGYYGSRSPQFAHESPQAKLMLHTGLQDSSFPNEAVDGLALAWPQAQIHRYPAGHAFNRSGHGDWHQASAELALQRSLEFLHGA